MKRFFCVLCLLCLMAGTATAEEDAKASLPQGVLSLCTQVYPDYRIGAYYSRAGENSGQCALALTNGQENILCIAEKAESDEAFAFTVENRRAVFAGDRLPDLYIDTGGDALFYSYRLNDECALDYYAYKGQDGVWHAGNASCYQALEEWSGWLQEGYLSYAYYRTDENDSILDNWNYAPIPVSAAFEERMTELSTFDIEALPAQPTELTDELMAGLAGALLGEDDTLLDVHVQRDALILLAEAADGARRIVIAEWNDAESRYATVETGALPQGASLDTAHAQEGEIILNLGERKYSFLRCGKGGGAYSLSRVMAEEDFGAGVNYICDDEGKSSGVGRNDGYAYGAHPWSDLTKMDLTALPTTLSEALSKLDNRGYAVVNNPDPTDRLHLRAEPDRNAASQGKFYNRMPVRVLDVQGDWAHVRAGERTGLEGWMLMEDLAFGDDMRGVKCAFPQLTVKTENPSATIYSAPDERSTPVATAKGGDCFIVGVYADEWFLVMTNDGCVGYARQDYFWSGNA